MGEVSSFVAAIRAASGELRREPHSLARLNQIAARIDQLGRRLHGMDWVRAQEIGACLTAAVRELDLARRGPEAARAEPVRQALDQLESARTHTAQGVRPWQETPVTEFPREEAATGRTFPNAGDPVPPADGP